MMLKRIATFAAVATLGAGLAGCNDGTRANRHWVPISGELQSLMAQKGMHKHSPILIRSYKKEAELEIWKQGADGQYALLKSFPICRWSGQLGPKVREGDRQAPEGFYTIAPSQMNPNSSFHLSFDTGFPNSFDRAHSRTGSFLMVHGACSSRGCFSMTDKQIEDIYALVREAHSGGQRSVQMQSFPFRMTAENLAKHRFDPHIGFWKQLKEGSDHFEVTRAEPKVSVCGGRYTFNTNGACDPASIPADIRTAVASKRASDEAKVAELVAKGTPAVRVQYADGGQHPSFRHTSLAYAGGDGTESPVAALHGAPRTQVAEISRPEAIDAQQEIALGPDGKPVKQAAATLAKPAASTAAAAAPASSPRPATTQVARQPAVAPAAPASATAFAPTESAAKQEQSLFNRMLGSVGLGQKEETKPEEVAAPPAPPRRASTTGTKTSGQKTSEISPAVIPGARAPLAAEFSSLKPAR
ncbi:MAG: L,D-transpeptidase family protein [Beijerinckiaceae bacterium]